MTPQFDKLQRLAVVLKAGQPVPDDLATWLLNGIGEFYSGVSLSRALALESGKRSEKNAIRNYWIKEAAICMFALSADYEAIDVAIEIAHECRQIYNSQLWRNRRVRQIAVIDNPTTVRECLIMAFRSVADVDRQNPVPTSVSQIDRLITED